MRQLIYTSVPTGLARGRSGFCTVARHASLRERTVEELEKMSGYEPPGDARPTVFLFRVYSGGNETLYILTRAGDAGTDFCGRANHIVHHLIFSEDEISALPPPAEVALRFRGWCEKFSEEPHFLPENEPLPQEILLRENEKLLPAKRWAELTGDGGNAALLCPHGDARATIFIGDESMTATVLGLFAESAAVLGRNSAWEIAFSTGICSGKGAGRFLWRMVSERELAVRRPGDFILDFLAPLALLRAPDTEFAEYARSGAMPAAPVSSARKNLPALADEEVVQSVPAGTSDSEIFSGKTDFSPPGPPQSSPERSASVSPAAVAANVEKHFSDIAGTAKFLGISGLVFVVVMASVLFLTPEMKKPQNLGRSAAVPVVVSSAETPEISENSKEIKAFCAFLEERISSDDFVGAAEAWISFSDAFPQEAEALRQNFVPRFKLKIASAYAELFSRRLRVADMGGKLSAEEKQLLAAELAMFRRACREFELTPGRIQKKNLAVVERAEAALED